MKIRDLLEASDTNALATKLKKVRFYLDNLSAFAEAKGAENLASEIQPLLDQAKVYHNPLVATIARYGNEKVFDELMRAYRELEQKLNSGLWE